MSRLNHLRYIKKLAIALVLALNSGFILADIKTVINNNGQPLSAQAKLNFELNIGKFMFLRVGSGTGYTGAESGIGPAASSSVNTVTMNVTPSIPATPTTPVNGTSAVLWTGASPTFQTSAAVSIPVEVRSNAGQVKITGQLTKALTSGSNSIPMSDLLFTSDASTLPAPQIPNSGVSAEVSVTLGGAGTTKAPTLLTYQTANWSYKYNSTTPPPPAGAYSGDITYTASSP